MSFKTQITHKKSYSINARATPHFRQLAEKPARTISIVRWKLLRQPADRGVSDGISKSIKSIVQSNQPPK